MSRNDGMVYYNIQEGTKDKIDSEIKNIIEKIDNIKGWADQICSSDNWNCEEVSEMFNTAHKEVKNLTDDFDTKRQFFINWIEKVRTSNVESNNTFQNGSYAFLQNQESVSNTSSNLSFTQSLGNLNNFDITTIDPFSETYSGNQKLSELLSDDNLVKMINNIKQNKYSLVEPNDALWESFAEYYAVVDGITNNKEIDMSAENLGIIKRDLLANYYFKGYFVNDLVFKLKDKVPDDILKNLLDVNITLEIGDVFEVEYDVESKWLKITTNPIQNFSYVEIYYVLVQYLASVDDNIQGVNDIGLNSVFYNLIANYFSEEKNPDPLNYVKPFTNLINNGILTYDEIINAIFIDHDANPILDKFDKIYESNISSHITNALNIINTSSDEKTIESNITFIDNTFSEIINKFNKVPTYKELSTEDKLAIEKEIYYVGDSRTLEQYMTKNGIGWGATMTVNDDDFLAKAGAGYSWFKENIASVYATNKPDIVIGFGGNDLGSIDNYIEEYISIAKNLPDKNIYIVSVNPTTSGGMYHIDNQEILTFNSSLKKAIENSGLSNLKYIDTNSILSKEGYETRDGVHYNQDTYNRISNYIASFVSENK